LLRRHCPASTLIRPCPTPVLAAADRDVEAATLTVTGLPRLLGSPFRRAVPTTPADQAGARVDCFPARTAFPKWQEGRHPHCHFRGLLRLHSRYRPPDRSAAHRRPLSRGSSPCGYPHEPLVSYRINRQLSGWILPPLVMRAFGAHCHFRTFARAKRSLRLSPRLDAGRKSRRRAVNVGELERPSVQPARAKRPTSGTTRCSLKLTPPRLWYWRRTCMNTTFHEHRSTCLKFSANLSLFSERLFPGRQPHGGTNTDEIPCVPQL
jgi:hypothetical protein